MPLFWAMFAGNFFIPFAVLLWRKGRTPTGTVIASTAIVIGMWIERYMIVVPSLTRPPLGFEPAPYMPTLVEVFITVGSIALFTFLFFMFFKVFPAISAWEVAEGMEKAEASRLAEEILEKGHRPAPETA
jgi:molybdopterin-containing oxidoreductase family membrane subunit